MIQNDEIRKQFYDHQVNEIADRYSRAQVERLEHLLEVTKERETHAIEVVINIGLMVCPQQLDELQRKDPVRTLSEFPLKDLEGLITLAVRMLSTAISQNVIDESTAIKNLREDNMKLQGQLKKESHRANEYQLKLALAQQVIKELQKGGGQKRAIQKAIEISDALQNAIHKENTGGGKIQDRPTTETEEIEKSHELTNVLEEKVALTRFMVKWEKQLTKRERDFCTPILIYMGKTGDCFRAEIARSLSAELTENSHTIASRLDRFVYKYQWLEIIKLDLQEEGKVGRPTNAYALTAEGKMGYAFLSGEIAKPSKLEGLSKYKIFTDHAALIYNTVKAFEHIGLQANIETKRIMLSDGRHFDPDITIMDERDGRKHTCYVEVETADHISEKVLYSKWRNSAEVQDREIYVVMRTKTEAKDLAYSVLRYWMTDTEQDKDVTLYTTSLEYLREFKDEDHPRPWSEVRILTARKSESDN